MSLLHNILHPKATTPIDADQLQAYMQGTLNPEAQHKLEAQLQAGNDPFAEDAIEGLKALPAHNIDLTLYEINSTLHKKLAAKNKEKKKKLNTETITILAAVTILVLVIISYIIIHMSSTK